LVRSTNRREVDINIWYRYFKRAGHLHDLDIEVRIALVWILTKEGGLLIHFFCMRTGTAV
jgi:hypothetical protein